MHLACSAQLTKSSTMHHLLNSDAATYYSMEWNRNGTPVPLRKPKNAPKKVDGTEMPNLQSHHYDISDSRRSAHQRQRRASNVVNGMAAAELYDHRTKLRKKKIPNTIPGKRKAVISTLLFHRNPPIRVNIQYLFYGMVSKHALDNYPAYTAVLNKDVL